MTGGSASPEKGKQVKAGRQTRMIGAGPAALGAGVVVADVAPGLPGAPSVLPCTPERWQVKSTSAAVLRASGSPGIAYKMSGRARLVTFIAMPWVEVSAASMRAQTIMWLLNRI